MYTYKYRSPALEVLVIDSCEEDDHEEQSLDFTFTLSIGVLHSKKGNQAVTDAAMRTIADNLNEVRVIRNQFGPELHLKVRDKILDWLLKRGWSHFPENKKASFTLETFIPGQVLSLVKTEDLSVELKIPTC